MYKLTKSTKYLRLKSNEPKFVPFIWFNNYLVKQWKTLEDIKLIKFTLTKMEANHWSKKRQVWVITEHSPPVTQEQGKILQNSGLLI